MEKPEHELGYPEPQAKRIVGKGLWDDFANWMAGQTVAVDEVNGATIYYTYDVQRYLDMKRTGRKEHPLEWD